MKKIYIRTPAGTYPIDQTIAEKYRLKPGDPTPFTGSTVVDQFGRSPAPKDPKAQNLEGTKGELINDGIAEIDNALTLSQSEIIDFSQGTDSNPNG